MRHFTSAFTTFALTVFLLGFASPAFAQTSATLGAHTLAWYECGTPAASLITSPIATQPFGSTLLAWVARGYIHTFTEATTPVDNKGNTFSILGTVHDYSPLYPGAGEAMYAIPSAVGGANHVFTAPMLNQDEVTFAVIEVKNGGVIQDVQWNKVLNGTPNTSASVTTTGPATLIAVWAGDGAATGMTAVPNNGFTVVESQLINTTCAIQTVIAAKEVSAAGTYDVTWTASPAQGAHLWLIAVQGASVPDAAPSITAHPQGQSVTVGQTATFSVSATGSPAPTYQWQKNGIAISGATGAIYTTPSTVIGDDGAQFSAVVSNSLGSVTSNAAMLTVTPVPADTTAPSVPAGLSGTAASTTQINLSWTASTDNVGVAGYKVFRDGTQVATPASTSFTDTGLTASTAYSYTVAAYDAAGNTSAQSAPVSVTTLAPSPSIPLALGVRVTTTENLQVRSTAKITASNVRCTQPLGALGTINGGPTVASGYTWWKVNFDTSCDGWAVQDYLMGVNPRPTVSLTGSPTSIVSGKTSTLTWSSTNATSCTGTNFTPTSTAGSMTVAPTVTTTYSITCIGSGGSRSASRTITVTADTTVPSTPTNLNGTAVSQAQINLTWTASTDNVGVTGYKVFRDGTQVGISATTAYSDTGLTAGTAYSYRVSAYDAAGNNSAQSTAKSVTTLSAPVPAPTVSLSASPVSIASGGSSTLTWSSTNATSCTGTGFTASGTSGSVSVSPSVTTIYSITCTGSGGTSAPASATVTVTVPPTDIIAPSVPTNLVGGAVSTSQINLTWTASTDNVGVVGYKVFRNGTQVGTPSATSFSDTGLSASTAYSYTVAAYDAAGNTSVQSSAASATTLDPVPVGLATEAVTVLNANSTPVATLSVPRSGIQASEIAVIVNDHDPQSVEIANYYQQKRGIPAQNMIHVNFDENKSYGFPKNNGMDDADFAAIRAQIEAAAGPHIQAYVVSWSKPFRIASWAYYTRNYSITSALGFGIDPNYLEIDFCSVMPVSPYYDTNSTKPYTDFGVRPTMMLAGTSVANVKAMIDRAVLADGSMPSGNGWFVRTSDTARSDPRYQDFQSTVQAWNRPEALLMNYYDYYANGGNNAVQNQSNVLFYQTGIALPANITSNTYALGAVADHLTSNGGDLFGTDQMSSLRWLEAGAAGSFGTVIEPCPYPEKFPRASVLVKNYFRGNTLVEAYQKSVQWPAQGVLIGDPLTRPFGTKATLVDGTLTVTTTSLEPGVTYALYSAPSSTGPFTQIATVSVPNYQIRTITVSGMTAPFYKLESTTAPADTSAPSIPAGLSGAAVSPSQINLTWTASTDNVGVVGYKVFRNGTQVGTPSATSFSDTGLSASTAYSYTVAAYDAAGNTSAQSSVASVTTLAAPAPVPTASLSAAPASITAGNNSTLTWSSTDATSCTGSGFTASGTSGSVSVSPSITTTYSITCTGSGGTSSPASATVTVSAVADTIPPSVPTGLAGTATSQTQIDLSWTASTDNVGVAGYKVFRNGTQVSTPASTFFSDTGLTASTTYSYTVAAYDAAGNTSAQSSVANVTTLGSVPAGDAATLGAHVLAWRGCDTASATSLSTPPVTTQSSGSTILSWVGKGYFSGFTTATIPIDNKGNVFNLIGSVHDYSPLWPGSGEALYGVPSAIGGTNHIFTAPMIGSDIITFATVEVKNGGVIQDVQWNKVLSGSANTSLDVTTTGPATLIAVWAGDSGAPGQTAVPNNGFTVIESQMTNTTCAMQTVIAAKEVPAAGTYNVTWASTPTQGAHMWLVAVQ